MNKIQITVNFENYYYCPEPMYIEEIKKFFENIQFYDYFYSLDSSFASTYEKSIFCENIEELDNFCKDKISKKEDPEIHPLLEDKNFYYDVIDNELDIPKYEFYVSNYDYEIYYLGYNTKIPYYEILEECDKQEICEINIQEVSTFLENTVPLNLDKEFNGIPCIVYYKSKIISERMEYTIFSGYNYLKNKFLTDPNSLVKVKKLFLDV